ncbi:MAG: 2-aminoadipate transaminase [Frankiaceae bacterium]|nr:2-aminoadipate transaminase [Frankiaceae bacterium]
MWVQLPDGIDAKAMQARAVSARVAYVPGIAFYADGSGGSHMRLSYCFPPPERITEGVRRLAAVLQHEVELRETFGKTYHEGPHPSDGSRSYAPAPDLA